MDFKSDRGPYVYLTGASPGERSSTTRPAVSRRATNCLPSALVSVTVRAAALKIVRETAPFTTAESICIVRVVGSTGLESVVILELRPDMDSPLGNTTLNWLVIGAATPKRGSGPTVVDETVPSGCVIVVVPFLRSSVVVTTPAGSASTRRASPVLRRNSECVVARPRAVVTVAVIP